MDFKIPFIGRSIKYTEDEIKLVSEVMRSAVPLTQGAYLNEFQNSFSDFIKSKYAFAINNAANALEISAQLCQFKSDEEIIIPAHTYTASAYPFIKKGAKIVWADIDLKTKVITVDTIEKCISSKTKAIVVVHLYGYGADMPEIMKLAKKHKLIVIEDAAQAMGVRVNGKMVGTFGDFGIFSFHSHKNITTLGEGGMLIVKDHEIAKIIPMIRHNGHCSFNFNRDDYWKPAMGNVDLPELNKQKIWPNNYCLGEVECALGTKLLKRIDAINEQKRKRAIYFIDSLNKYSEIVFHREETNRHNYHLLTARFLNNKRDKFIKNMALKGIQCVVQYYPLYRYDLYKKAGLSKANCPNTDLFFDNMISFPFHHMLSEDEFDFMLETAKKCLDE